MNSNLKQIYIVVPVYNEEKCIHSFVSAFDMMKNDIDEKMYNLSIVFVDDGSKDNTKNLIKGFDRNDIKYISFSKNFGKEAALLAGLRAVKQLKGDAAIIMDVDLQDPIELIPQMLTKYAEGYNHITTKHISQHSDSYFMKFCTKTFYNIFSLLTGFKSIRHGSRDYSLLDKKVIDAFLSFSEYDRFTKGISECVGFKTYCIEFNYVKRIEGKSKWNFRSLFKYAFVGINSFSTWLNLFPKIFGLAFFGLLIYDIYEYFVTTGYGSLNIRLDVIAIVVCIFVDIVIRLIYTNKALIEKRSSYFIEESNIEE